MIGEWRRKNSDKHNKKETKEMLRGDSQLRTVMEGKMKGKKTRGRLGQKMLD